jgi:AmmeMemoRadiSam system protein A
MILSKAHKKTLLNLARSTIFNLPFKEDLSQFKEKQGAFVTLHSNNELRGCIGFTEPVYPLSETIKTAAKLAAFEDPRFPPLDIKKEKVKIEISVLTLPKLIKEKPENNIKLGEDGLIINSKYGSGLLLPQVFTAYNVNPIQALEMTCQKAGLPKDFWKSKEAKIYKFQADIFSE